MTASVTEAAVVNPEGTKTLLGDGVSKCFINGKPAVINGLRKLRNPPSWLVFFLVVHFIKIPLFSKDLITFIISFISLFVRVIPQPIVNEIPFSIFLPIILSPVSTRMSLFFSICILQFFYIGI